MPTTNQLVRKGRKSVKKKSRVERTLAGAPHRKGRVISVSIRNPKKPNSAERKVARVRLSNGIETTAMIPGEGHNLIDHADVLVMGGGAQDVPGVRLSVVRGAQSTKPPHRCNGGENNSDTRKQGRSKYGQKKEKMTAEEAQELWDWWWDSNARLVGMFISAAFLFVGLAVSICSWMISAVDEWGASTHKVEDVPCPSKYPLLHETINGWDACSTGPFVEHHPVWNWSPILWCLIPFLAILVLTLSNYGILRIRSRKERRRLREQEAYQQLEVERDELDLLLKKEKIKTERLKQSNA